MNYVKIISLCMIVSCGMWLNVEGSQTSKRKQQGTRYSSTEFKQLLQAMYDGNIALVKKLVPSPIPATIPANAQDTAGTPLTNLAHKYYQDAQNGQYHPVALKFMKATQTTITPQQFLDVLMYLEQAGQRTQPPTQPIVPFNEIHFN